MNALRIADFELRRAWRRRVTFWTFVVLAVLIQTTLLFAVTLPEWDLPLEGASWAELIARLLAVFETILIAFLAVSYAHDSMRREDLSGSGVLLHQAPLDAASLLLGRGLGVALAVLGLHAFLRLQLLVPTPVMRRPHAAVAAEFLLVWLLAVGFLPDGFLLAAIGRRRRRGERAAYALAQAVRAGGAWLLLDRGIRPEVREKIGVLELVGKWLLGRFESWSPPVSAYLESPRVTLGALLGWHLLAALGLFLWCLRLERR